MEPIYKYPRTYPSQGAKISGIALEVSRSPQRDLEGIPFKAIANRHLVVEEKVDGANVAISFSTERQILLQSRGNYLTGGGGEKSIVIDYSQSITI